MGGGGGERFKEQVNGAIEEGLTRSLPRRRPEGEKPLQKKKIKRTNGQLITRQQQQHNMW
jgi:hypothetical protein